MKRLTADFAGLPTSFWRRVFIRDDGCWEWRGPRDPKGYGKLWAWRLDGTPAHRSAHALAYEAFRGAIPNGLVLDHQCDREWCANPWHVEPATHRANILRGDGPCARHARKIACRQGHPFVTVVRSGRTRRMCPTCHRVQNTESARRMRAQRRVAVGQ